MNVSQILIRAVKKVYLRAQELKPEYDNFALMLFIMSSLGLSDEKDYHDFVKKLPKDIKQAIKLDYNTYYE
jgi:hypothetical protein